MPTMMQHLLWNSESKGNLCWFDFALKKPFQFLHVSILCTPLRGVINGKAGKAAAFLKFSDMLILSRHVAKFKNLGGQVVMRRAAAARQRLLIRQNPLAIPCLEKFYDYAPATH